MRPSQTEPGGAWATGAKSDEANVHLLAALGKFNEPFVPVNIHRRYDGYS